MMSVGFFDVRAISIALFTAMVVVPAPPLTPKNDRTVLVRVPSFDFDRSAVRWIAAVNESSSGQARYSLAPARMACRICSGCADAAIAKIVADGQAPRSRSMASVLAPWRMSTIVSDGGFAVAWRSSTIATEVPEPRRHFVTCARKSGSVLEMRTVSCAMVLPLLDEDDCDGERTDRRRAFAGRQDSTDWRNASEDVVTLHLFDEEPHVIDHLQVSVAAVLLAGVVVHWIKERNGNDARTRMLR